MWYSLRGKVAVFYATVLSAILAKALLSGTPVRLSDHLSVCVRESVCLSVRLCVSLRGGGGDMREEDRD